ADLHAARRAHRAAWLRGLPGEAAQARDRPQSTDRQRGPHPARPNYSLQTRQGPPEYRVVDPVRDDSGPILPEVAWQPRVKFQDRGWLHVLLFMLTLVTTTFAGAGHYASFLDPFSTGTQLPMPLPALVLRGFWYSGTILAILGAHELG